MESGAKLQIGNEPYSQKFSIFLISYQHINFEFKFCVRKI